MKGMNRRFIRIVAFFLIALLLCLALPSLAYPPATVGLIVQSPSAFELEQRARSRYEARQFSEAATLFQQAVNAYQSTGDSLRQALSLSNLSLCYQQLGAWEQANRAILESLAILQNQPDSIPATRLALAQALDIQADLLLSRGQASEALAVWEQVTLLYQQQGKTNRALEGQTNQAKALQQMGLHRQAIARLQTALKLSAMDPEPLKAELAAISPSFPATIALHRMGESLRMMGDASQAQIVLERCLAIAQQLQLQDVIALVQLSLGNIVYGQAEAQTATGNVESAKSSYQQAAAFYQQASDRTAGSLRVQIQLNHLRLLLRTKQAVAAQRLASQLQQQIATLPRNRESIEARINLAKTLLNLAEALDLKSLEQSLVLATQQATALGDPRLQSYAMGNLGNVYERSRQWKKATQLTQQALQLVQPNNAGEIAYLWQWQLGRILKAEGDTKNATIAYQGAFSIIKSLREDLAVANPEVQFSFRDAIEPIHRQLVELLLQSDQPDRLKTARDVIESLQSVELDNFFREACLNANPAQIDQVDQKAAVIYPILLENQLAIITSVPRSASSSQRDLRHYTIGVPRSEVEHLVEVLRDDLDQPNALELALPNLQKLYAWLLGDLTADLAKHPVETLVFVLDGALRNIPMSALHDGKQFLIEKYSVAITPGLQLLSPRSLKQEKLSVFAAGLSTERANFRALRYVEREIQAIQSGLPNQVLLNQAFTSQAFQQQIATVSFPIIHLATHGKFGGTADETFILTWDGKLTVNQLSSVLKRGELSREKPLELLVLSACETADGDNRAALGLAGVAVRSGARSTVATLWQINDQAAATLMGKFYNELAQINQTGISKAEALRRAQLAILHDPSYENQPYYWAAFVLIGNWT